MITCPFEIDRLPCDSKTTILEAGIALCKGHSFILSLVHNFVQSLMSFTLCWGAGDRETSLRVHILTDGNMIYFFYFLPIPLGAAQFLLGPGAKVTKSLRLSNSSGMGGTLLCKSPGRQILRQFLLELLDLVIFSFKPLRTANSIFSVRAGSLASIQQPGMLSIIK